jgi:phosphoribosylpyrophosphate synthetase
LVLHPDDQRAAAERFAAALDLTCRAITTRRFPDGETLLRLPVPLPERVIIFCTSTSRMYAWWSCCWRPAPRAPKGPGT